MKLILILLSSTLILCAQFPPAPQPEEPPSSDSNPITVNGIELGPDKDLSDMEFINLDLSGQDLGGCNFYRSRFINCNLSGVDFSDSIFREATIQDCNLENTILTYDPNAYDGWTYKNLKSSGNYGTPLSFPFNVGIPPILIKGYLLLPYSDLSGADLSNINVTPSEILDHDAYDSNGYPIIPKPLAVPLEDWDTYSSPYSLPFSWRPFGMGGLINPSFYHVNLSGANLSNSKFYGIDFRYAIFDNAIIDNVKFIDCLFPSTYFFYVKFSDTVFYHSVDFLYEFDYLFNRPKLLDESLIYSGNIWNWGVLIEPYFGTSFIGCTFEDVEFTNHSRALIDPANPGEYWGDDTILMRGTSFRNSDLQRVTFKNFSLELSVLENLNTEGIIFNNTDGNNHRFQAFPTVSAFIAFKGEVPFSFNEDEYTKRYAIVKNFIIGPNVSLKNKDLSEIRFGGDTYGLYDDFFTDTDISGSKLNTFDVDDGLFEQSLFYGYRLSNYSNSDFDAIIAERDARPTQADYDSMVAERDARPTQADYDSMVAERDARPTQADYDVLSQELVTLENRVYDILPKLIPDSPIFDYSTINDYVAIAKQEINNSREFNLTYSQLDLDTASLEAAIDGNDTITASNLIDGIINYLDSSTLSSIVLYDFSLAIAKYEIAKIYLSVDDLNNAASLIAEAKLEIENSRSFDTTYQILDSEITKLENALQLEDLESANDSVEDIIYELEYSEFSLNVQYDFTIAKSKFELVNEALTAYGLALNEYDSTPIVTTTLEEYVESLNEDISNFQNEISQKLSIQEVQDLRLGSTMIEVSGNQATVQLQMEESSDLESWQDSGTPASMTIPADTNIKFFRFKMAE